MEGTKLIPSFKLWQLVFAFLFVLPFISCAQGGAWVWMRGSDSINPTPAYPIQGLTDTSNNPPALDGAASWTDLDGNFWIFGGYGDAGYLSDLWKFNPYTNKWTWVKGAGMSNQIGIYGIQGLPSDSAMPGARFQPAAWTDNNGDLWLMGGISMNINNLNDLWKYNIATNRWTWMKGSKADSVNQDVYGTIRQPAPTNTPGGRYGCSTWTDNNDNLWLFGGANYWIAGDPFHTFYNDMWKYDIQTNEWTVMNWSPGIYPYHYGSKGVENISNLPPARASSAAWKDTADNFYLFGGGLSTLSAWEPPFFYNDVWKYNIINSAWTWISGDTTYNPGGDYPSFCINSLSAHPTSKTNMSFCQAMCNANKAIIFGGESTWELNDLWLFDNKSNAWKFLDGNTIANDTGSYGTCGVADLRNLPPARSSSCQWIDKNSTIWIFGGTSHLDANSYFNDVWKFVPDTSCVSMPLNNGVHYSISKRFICPDDTVLLDLTGNTETHVSPASYATQVDSTHYFLYPASTQTYRIIGQSYCGTHDTTNVTIYALPDVNIEVMAADTIFCPGDSIVLSAVYGFNHYQWSNGDTGSYIYVNSAGVYKVTVSEGATCSATSESVSVGLFATQPVQVSQSGDTLIAHGDIAYEFYWNGTPVSAFESGRSKYVASHLGTYVVLGIDSNGCQVNSQPIIISGIGEISGLNIGVYPNPTAGVLSVMLPFAYEGNCHIEIENILGQSIYKGYLKNNQVDIGDLAPGIYLLKLEVNGASQTAKFVKE